MLLILPGCVQQTFYETTEQFNAIQEELVAIKTGMGENKEALKNQPKAERKKPIQQPFKPAKINLGDTAFLGKIDAPITLVEYTDYHCPFCKRHANSTLPMLKKNYIKTGKLKYKIMGSVKLWGQGNYGVRVSY